jgi:hypothetical protein
VRVTACVVAILVGAFCVEGAYGATTRSELIRKGDALCARVKRELAPLRVRAQAANSLPEDKRWPAAAELWSDQIRIQKRFVNRFHAIGLPPNDRRARLLSRGLDRGVVLAQRVQRAFVQHDTTALSGALRAYIAFTLDLNRRTRAYGFRVCGR